MTTAQDILALEERRWQAVTAADWTALEALIHDDLVYTHAHAKVDTKASYLAGLKNSPGRILTVRRSQEQVRLFGDTAYIAGALESDFELDGMVKLARVRFISIWTKTPQGWKFCGWQTTAQP
jgi:ketosteroid isomerase-like protein